MTDTRQRRVRLAQMAELNHHQRWTQSAIAERFGLSTMQICRLLCEAQQLGVVEFRIHHPLPVDQESARELQRRFGLRSVLAVRTSCPVLRVGRRSRGEDGATWRARRTSRSAGSVPPATTRPSARWGTRSRSELDGLRAKGAVGDVLGRFIEGEGRPVPWTHAETSVSLSFDDLKRIPQVIAVAVGPSKVQPLLGPLRGGFLSHLIMDADTVR